MRTGVLSDEAVMKSCAEFFPVPMNASKVLMHNINNTSGLQFRESKYSQMPPRPENFYTMSNNMANNIDPTNKQAVINRLSQAYVNEMKNDNDDEIENGNGNGNGYQTDSTASNGNGNGNGYDTDSTAADVEGSPSNSSNYGIPSQYQILTPNDPRRTNLGGGDTPDDDEVLLVTPEDRERAKKQKEEFEQALQEGKALREARAKADRGGPSSTNEPYLGDYTGPRVPLGTGTILGDNPSRPKLSLDSAFKEEMARRKAIQQAIEEGKGLVPRQSL